MNGEKHIGNSNLNSEPRHPFVFTIAPGAVTTEKLADDAVTTDKLHDEAVTERKLGNQAVTEEKLKTGAVTRDKIANKAVTSDKIGDDVITDYIAPAIEEYGREYYNKIQDLQNQIDSMEQHGVAVSNEFGDDPHIGISQKTLTGAINTIWAKISDMTGEPICGIDMIVNPTYFIGHECEVHMKATSVEANGIFEHIAFYADNELLAEAENVEVFEQSAFINGTKVIRCVAKILGIEYTKSQVVVQYPEVFMGGGQSYEDVLNQAHVIPQEELGPHLRIVHDVTCAQGDHIIIIVGSYIQGFIRADMNGFEVAMEESTVTQGDNTYTVYTSVNAFNAGTYNIDVNG